jgi:hypothetical protein
MEADESSKGANGPALVVAALFVFCGFAALGEGKPAPPLILLAAALVIPLGLVVHELGHALVGRALGLRVLGVSLGVGPARWRFRVRGVEVEVAPIPVAGHVIFDLRGVPWVRTRLWVATAAGPLANLALVALVADSARRALEGGGVVAYALFPGLWLSNLFLGFGNLVPFRKRRGDRPGILDGRKLIEIPRWSDEQLKQAGEFADAHRVVGAWMRGDLDGARALAVALAERRPDWWFPPAIVGDVDCKRHEWVAAVAAYRASLAVAGPERRFQVGVALAWALVGAGTPESLAEADEVSAATLVGAEGPAADGDRAAAARGARGAVLLELGRVDEAVAHLRAAAASGKGRENWLLRAYLAWGEHVAGDRAAAGPMLDEARRKLGAHPLVERVAGRLQGAAPCGGSD